MSNPTDQFIVKKWLDLSFFGIDMSITNSSFAMIVATSAIIFILFLITRGRRVIPGYGQIISEKLYGFIEGMLIQYAGEKAEKYTTLVMSLFLFILFGNMLGMISVFYTFTSQIIITAFFALTVFFSVIFIGLKEQGFRFFNIFFPPNVPKAIMPFMLVIELVSFFAKPVSLSLRLCINMIAGHMMLKIFAGFAATLPASSVIIVPVLLVLTVFELLTSALQAYIFTLLTCIYLKDAVHGH